MRTSNEKNINLGLIIFFLIIGYISISNMKAVYSSPLPFKEFFLIGVTLIGMITLFIYLIIKINNINKLFFIFIIFIFVSLIPTYNLYKSFSIYSIIRIYGEMYLWIAVFVLSYILHVRKGMEFINKIAFVILLVFTYFFFNIKEYSVGNETALISMVYYCLFLLPFVLIMKNKYLKFLGILIISISVLLSVKRTAILALLGVLLLYYFINNKMQMKKGNKRLITSKIAGLLTIVFMVMFLNYIVETFNLDIFDRLLSMLDDEGSGRLAIWERTLDMQIHSSFAAWIFGHGFNAVYMSSYPQYSAHNDFIEVLYDFGIFGSLIYFYMYVILIKYSIKLYKKKSKYAAPFISSIALALIMSLTSHIIIYPTYFIYLCIFWGMVISFYDKKY